MRFLSPAVAVAVLCLTAAAASGASPARGSRAVASRACSAAARAAERRRGAAEGAYRPGVVLLAFRRDVPAARRSAIERAVGGCGARPLGPPRGDRVQSLPGERFLLPIELRVPVGRVRAVVARLRHYDAVAYAEPNYVMHANAVPNDPGFALQWGDSNSGQEIPTSPQEGSPTGPDVAGTPGADDGAARAWRVSTGSPAIVIGEVDTGVDYAHPDLAANIWSNPEGVGGCPAGAHGYDVLALSSAEQCDPMDRDTSYGGHGTHVAGIMGAVGDNGIGVAGIDWNTTILSVRWLDSAGAGSTADLVEALQWLLRAKQEGVNVRVVNDSATFVGEAGGSQALEEAIEALGADGILFVTAAGNTGQDNNSTPRWPCDYDLPNEICVTASDDNDRLAKWANWGSRSVDLAAPGVSIYSTLREAQYGYLSGGSMAAPQVAGTAALILSVAPAMTPAELKADIVGHVDRLPGLEGRLISGGRLDVCRAVPGCVPPAAVTGGASSLAAASAHVNGTVNPNGATLSSCRFEYGLSQSYGASAPCASAPAGAVPVAVSAVLEGLAASTEYHYRLVASDAGGSGYGADQVLITQPSPPSAPTAGLSAPPAEPLVPPVPPVPQAAPVPYARLAGRSLLASRSGAVRIKVTCPAGESSCTGTVTLRTLDPVDVTAGPHRAERRRAILTLAVGEFSVAGGSARTVTLDLRKSALALLARLDAVLARATLLAHDPAGAVHTTRTVVTLRAYAPRPSPRSH